ncbi:MAG TPA: DEAD/DEAH box helicase family protein, partial [Candidatus Hydrogenedentes bacterium]|nr:DEAD/DEAH box helicase family protein [Candidatus Hydrogenedentota bacterium]
MLALKEYQQRSLDALRAYFTDYVRTGDADTAFYSATKREFGAGIAFQPVKEFPGLPYVCLRIPTGGGKTLVACHAVSAARRELLQTEHPVVLWLVPSNAIREQTLKALRDRGHHYRQALEATCGGVEVMDVAGALCVTRATLDAQTTVIVSTMQAFRVEDTEGRKVYEGAGALKHHFDNVPAASLPRLQRFEDGTPVPSLANVLCMRRPVVIVDEAHNARTGLSFETLARFHPSCIIEFSATPDRLKNPSNILHSVSAAELKAERMIKMPIRLETRPEWKELLADAVACQRNLEKIARMERQQTGEYIRPIVLVQAQAHSKQQDTLSVEEVRRCLLEDHRVPEEQVAVATGTTNEIENVDILSEGCEIRFVITMQALREGWDCPFAYVLCSVAELKSATYIEQILGRVMRLPKATEKNHEELNVAYAFASSPYWSHVANMLTDALVRVHGFEKQDAKDLIVQVAAPEGETGELFSDFMGSLTVTLPEPLAADTLPDCVREEAAVYEAKTPDGGAAVTLTFQGKMSETQRDALQEWVSTPEAKARIERVFRQSNGLDPDAAKTRAPFSVPGLAVKQGGIFELFEDQFLEDPWDLRECDA